MSENLFVGTHKFSNKSFRQGYDRINWGEWQKQLTKSKEDTEREERQIKEYPGNDYPRCRCWCYNLRRGGK